MIHDSISCNSSKSEVLDVEDYLFNYSGLETK